MAEYKIGPHKNQLNFLLKPWFNLFCIILCSIIVLWSNYVNAEISGFSPIKAIPLGMFSFVGGILAGVTGGKWQIKAIEEKWSEIKGWKSFLNNVLWETKAGKKVAYHGILMATIPFIVIISIRLMGFSKYRGILAICYSSYVFGVMSGLYLLPIYLWSRKLPD